MSARDHRLSLLSVLPALALSFACGSEPSARPSPAHTDSKPTQATSRAGAIDFASTAAKNPARWDGDGFVVATGSTANASANSLTKRLEARLPPEAASSFTVKAGSAETKIRREHASSAPATFDRGAVTYTEAWPGVDAIVFAKGRGVEELLVMRGSAREASYRVEVPRGFRLERPTRDANLVELRDPLGVPRLRFSALAAWDRDARRIPIDLLLEGDRLIVRVPKDARGPVLVDPEWSTASDMALARSFHTATLLPNGKVLVTGGETLGIGLSELYDPITQTFSATGALVQPRASGQTATVLLSGKVLVAGGSTASDAARCVSSPNDAGCAPQQASTGLAEAEIYDPEKGTFEVVGPPKYARTEHAATLLADGTVLLTGGVSEYDDPNEIFDPATGTFREARRLAYPRTKHSALLLPSGKVFVVGGGASPELVDPSTGGSEVVQASSQGRAGVLLPSGKVLFDDGLFDPLTTQRPGEPPPPVFTAMSCPADRGVLLPSGHVLFSRDAALSLMDPVAGTCTDVTTAGVSPRGSSATLLPTGAVLFAGGDTTTASLFAERTDTRVSTGGLDTAREHHAAALLPSGKVLLVGGALDATRGRSTEIYDPLTGKFEPAGNTHTAFVRSAVAAFPSGLVYAAGTVPPPNFDQGPVPPPPHPLERFDAATHEFSIVGEPNAWFDAVLPFSDDSLLLAGGFPYNSFLQAYFLADGTTGLSLDFSSPSPPTASVTRPGGYALVANGASVAVIRSGASVRDGLHPAVVTFQNPISNPTMTLLATGDALLVGGSKASLFTANDIESPVAPPMHARADHTSTLLGSGKALIAGGAGEMSAELYVPSDAKFVPAASMHAVRAGHSATMLASGAVFVASDWTAEFYDPTADAWTVASTVSPLLDGGSETLLPDGHVLYAGGKDGSGRATKTTELFDPTTDRAIAGSSLVSARANHTATLLPTGDVLLAGGDVDGSTEIYSHESGTSSKGAALATPRSRHTATLLPNGSVLMAGGVGSDGNVLQSMEVFDPTGGSFLPRPNLGVARSGHAAVLLPSGRVLLAGGVTGSSGTLELIDPNAAGAGASTLVDGPALSGSVAAALLPSGDVLVTGGGVTFRFVEATGAIADPRPGPTGALGTRTLGLDGAFTCGDATCEHRRGGDSITEAVPHAPSSTGTLTALLDRSVLFRGRNDLGGGYTLRFGVVPSGAVRPRIASPGTITAGSVVTLRGSGLAHPTAVGADGAAARPDIFPLLFFVPASSGVPVSADVTAWTDDWISFRVPNTPFHGPGWLHAVVLGVPSEGAFVDVEPSPLGSACTSDPECGTGHCAEGACCDLACAGGCQSCRKALSGVGDGTCGNIAPGRPARFGCETRPEEPECSPSGTCNGSGECAEPDSNTPCSTASVTNGVCIKGACADAPPSKCGASGFSLVTAGVETACAGHLRCEKGQKSDVCLPACATQSDCEQPYACTSHGECRICTSDRLGVDIGNSQTGSTQTIPCGNYLCRDGECLASCVAVADCAPGAECRRSQCAAACNGAGDGVMILNGKGTDSTPCSPYRCQDGACLNLCHSHAECAKGYRCGTSSRCETDTLTALPTPPRDPACACAVISTRTDRGRAAVCFSALLGLVLGRRTGRPRRERRRP